MVSCRCGRQTQVGYDVGDNEAVCEDEVRFKEGTWVVMIVCSRRISLGLAYRRVLYDR